MRKLKLQMQMTLDGFVAGTNGEMDWMVWDWDDELKQAVADLTESVDTILLGKNLAQGFIPHWTKVADDKNHPEHSAGQKFVNTHKIVVSKTLTKSDWPNTTLANGDLVQEINKLKQQEGQDIIVYGGGAFVASLITNELIDEFNLFINPAINGKGIAIFSECQQPQKLKLEHSKAYPCGIVAVRYTLDRSVPDTSSE